MIIPIQHFFQLIVNAISLRGFSADHAARLAEWIMWATLRGNVQDARKISALRYEPKGDIAIREITSACLMVEANLHHPVLALDRAVHIGCSVTEKMGIASIGVTGTNQSSGALGYFVEQIADKGMIGILMSSTIPLVAPYGAAERVIGTNPVAVGIPGDSVIVWDESVALLSFYGVLAATAKGERLPEGVGIDAKGEPTTDPSKITFKEGALLAKGTLGSGLGIVVQLLAAHMLGEKDWGHFLIIIDPKAFGAARDFSADFARSFKAARRAQGVHEHLLPGERGARARKQVLESREIEISADLYRQLSGD